MNKRKKYLQIALNSTIEEARSIIFKLPVSERILIEAGTPLIKAYGGQVIRQIRNWGKRKMAFQDISQILERGSGLPFFSKNSSVSKILSSKERFSSVEKRAEYPYIVADMKTMDRGDREVRIAAENGASAAVCLGEAPIETIDSFIDSCAAHNIDSMVDMMNVGYPLEILRKLKKLPDVVILHRGVDEEKFNREKQIPYHEIHRIKGNYDIMISVAGGDTIREVQRAIFNDADIVVVWKEFYQDTADTARLAENFLQEIK